MSAAYSLRTLAFAALLGGCMALPLADLDSLWDYDAPAESEARFRARLVEIADDADASLETRTQLARALGLQQRFEEAHAELDRVEARLNTRQGRASPRIRARLHLERGRVLRSSGKAAESRPELERALAEADAAGEEFLACDALHMLAIVAPLEEQVAAHTRAIERVSRTRDERARRWLAPLTNNLAWAHHDRGEYAEALATFERAVPLFEARGGANEVRIARWSVARALRSLGRCEEALPQQLALLAGHRAAGSEDGFVHEEIAECLLALGRGTEARAHFADAHRLLSRDAWLVRDEAARLARLKQLAEAP